MGRNFGTLDGLRGAAAIVVLILHTATASTPDLQWFGFGYLAVDLFFLLSGFVIDHAYGNKLLNGMSFRRFLIVRLVRFYPLYLLGLAIAITTPVAVAVTTQQWWAAKDTLITLPYALFMLPRPVAEPIWFIINPPTWPLFYEIVGNVIYAMLILQLGKRTLIGIIVVAAIVLAVLSLSYGTLNMHPNWMIWTLTSFARMTFSFSLGVLMHRWWLEGALPAPRHPAIGVVLLFLGLGVLPSSARTAGVLTMAIVMIGFPLIVLAGIANEPSTRWALMMREAGRMSYALYVLHWPIMMALREIARHSGVSLDVAHIATVPISLLVAWYTSRYFDERVRARLGGRIRRRLMSSGPLTLDTVTRARR